MTVGYKIVCSDQHKLVVCIGGRLNIFDIEKRQKIVSCRPIPNPSYAAFSPNGKILAVKSTSGRIVVLNSFSGEVLCDHKNQKEGEGCQLHFSPDGEMLIDASWKGIITIRKAFEPTIIKREVFEGEHIGEISMDANRNNWLFQHGGPFRQEKKARSCFCLILHTWPLTEALRQHCFGEHIIWASALSPDASRICLIRDCKPGTDMRIIGATDGEILACRQFGMISSKIYWSWDSEIIAVIRKSFAESCFAFYKSSDLSLIGTIPGDYPSSICFLPNSDQVVLGSWQFSRLARLEDFLSGQVKMCK